jgi:hypothetical protein
MTDDPAATSLLLTNDGQPSAGTRERLVEVTVPVYNEEKVLEQSVRLLHSYLTENLPFQFVITIADNASTDGTFGIVQRMRAQLPRVRAVHLDRKGRGLALRHVWGSSEADIVAYMDADLSTGLDAFLPLIAPLLSGHSDLSVGSRLAHGAQVVRSTKREIISRAYNLLLRTVLAARFSDAQCGFKAGRTEVIRALPGLAQAPGLAPGPGTGVPEASRRAARATSATSRTGPEVLAVLAHRPAPEDRPRAGQRAGVGRLIRAGIPGAQLPAGHSASVLRQRDGSADRRAGRHRPGWSRCRVRRRPHRSSSRPVAYR